MRKMLAPVLALVAGLALTSPASAKETIRLVMPFAAGSATESQAGRLAQGPP